MFCLYDDDCWKWKTSIECNFDTIRHGWPSMSCKWGFHHRLTQGSGFVFCKLSYLMSKRMLCRRGLGKSMGEFGCKQQVLALKCWVLWERCPSSESYALQILEWLWISGKVRCSGLRHWNRIQVRLFSSDTHLPHTAANSSLDGALGRALWTAVVMLSLNIPHVCLPDLKCY